MEKIDRWMRKISWLAAFAWIGVSLPVQAQSLPDGTGKDTVQLVCSQCHGLSQVTNSKMTTKEWEGVVNDMVARGTPLMDDELPVVIEYLAKNFPPAKADNKINVNTAAAKQLADSLHLTADEAAALVKYRDQNGYFNNWEDLGKVAGLDLKKLEPMKDELAY